MLRDAPKGSGANCANCAGSYPDVAMELGSRRTAKRKRPKEAAGRSGISSCVKAASARKKERSKPNMFSGWVVFVVVQCWRASRGNAPCVRHAH